MPLFCPYCGSELEADYAFCRKCGKKVGAEAPPPPPAHVEAPALGPAPVPTIATELVLSRRVLALVLVSIIVVAAFTVFASTVKCIPVVRSYTEKQEFKYTYDYWQTDWKTTDEVVFDDYAYLGAFSASSSSWYQDSRSFRLGKYWIVQLDVSSNSKWAGASLYQKDGDRCIGSKTGTFVSPSAGEYYIYFSNIDSSSWKVSAKVTVVAKLETVMKTGAGTATFTVTKFKIENLTIVEYLMRRS